MAIQVSGTEVISNSRALNNIASVDATTAAAIGSAGVGGASSRIQSLTSLSSANTFTFNLNHGYNVYYLNIYNIMHADGGTRELYCRMGGPTGTTLTGSGDYWTSAQVGSSSSEGNNSYAKVAGNWPGSTGELSTLIKITNAEESSVPTMIEFMSSTAYDLIANTFYGEKQWHGMVHMLDIQVNQNISFYNAALATMSNATYEMWGVNV